MNKTTKIAIIIIFAAVFALSFYYFMNLPSSSEEGKASQNNSEEVLPEASGDEDAISYHPELSLQAFSQKEFDGRDLELGRVLESNSAYTRYYIIYKSGDLTISGIMNVPNGEGPFPVLILNHGYIDPAVYTNGRGLKREQDYFARNGFVVIHPDYRNHADSSRVENVEDRFRLGYAEDVANAVYAVRQSDMEFFDKDNIGMMGHSMGGGVALQLMASHPDLVGAVSLYAPVSADAYDNFDKWIRDREDVAQRILNEHGSPEDNPEFWDNLSPINFIDDMQAPVILHHGTADDSVPIEWSDRFVKEMEAQNKDIAYHVYEGGPHEFANSWPLFMQRNVEFFNRYLNVRP